MTSGAPGVTWTQECRRFNAIMWSIWNINSINDCVSIIFHTTKPYQNKVLTCSADRRWYAFRNIFSSLKKLLQKIECHNLFESRLIILECRSRSASPRCLHKILNVVTPVFARARVVNQLLIMDTFWTLIRAKITWQNWKKLENTTFT